MTKRAAGKFERKPRDFYATPYEAVLPLIPHLRPGTRFIEPCAGSGTLIRHLESHGMVCIGASDIEPRGWPRIQKQDFLTISDIPDGIIITNPPWRRPTLHAMIEKVLDLGCPAWLLIDADWAHTQQAAPYLRYCSDIVSVGRVKWRPGTASTGFDNVAWYRFQHAAPCSTLFHARVSKRARPCDRLDRTHVENLPDRGFWSYAVYFDSTEPTYSFRACPLEFCRASHPIHVSGPTAEFTRQLAEQVAYRLNTGWGELDASEMTNEQD